MEKLKFFSKSLYETEKIAEKILEETERRFGSYRGVVFFLEGELGSGKTTLVKFFTKKISGDEASSPTFTIINEYQGKILHIDLYRIDSADDIILFSQEKIQEGYTIFFEWGEKIKNSLFDKVVKIKISFGNDDTEREILCEFL